MAVSQAVKDPGKEYPYIVALGANLPWAEGSPAETLRASVAQLGALGLTTLKISRFFATPAFPPGNGPDYVNAVALLASSLSPHDVLAILHRVEAAFGRERAARWGQRTLDLDLIAAGDLVLPDRRTHADWRALPLAEQMSQTPQDLILPHPRLQDRAFVLVPMADVAPDWVHPILGVTTTALCDALPAQARAEVTPLPGLRLSQ